MVRPERPHRTKAHSLRTVRTVRTVPFDIDGMEAKPDWRDHFVWPVAPLDLEAMHQRVLTAYFGLVRETLGDDQRTAILAMWPIVGFAMSVFEIAAYADTEGATGVRVDSNDAEFRFIRGETSQFPPPRGADPLKKIAAPRLPFRRNAQVTSWWTPWAQLIPTMIRPEAVAVGENPLLIWQARRSKIRIAFRHGGIFLKEARNIGTEPSVDSAPVATKIVAALMTCLKVSGPIKKRVEPLLLGESQRNVALASRDLNSLQKIRDLPMEIWSGTAGDYATRAIGLEVIRRGGSVTRFDHGGTTGMIDYPEVVVGLELLATTTFVLPSEALAANVRASKASALIPNAQPPEIVWLLDPFPAPSIGPIKTKARRKVVYCPTLLLGFRRHSFCTLPDPVSMDWTLKITEELTAMPVDLLCKPHPEGTLQGREHPVSRIAKTSYRRFEDEMNDADVFVFDRCHSTAFWDALSTDRPVVYLEATPPALHPNIREAMERRCRILRATFDDQNCPQIDGDALREAVIGGDPRVDPTEMQKILLGKAA